MDVNSSKEPGGNSTDSNDQVLVELVKVGNRNAFSQLVKRHQKALLRLCYRFLKDLDLAEDVVQETFIKVFDRIHTFEARASFKSWLYQIAINTAKNKIRSFRMDTTDIENVNLAVMADAERGLIHNAVSQLLQKYVEQLPFKQRTALVLRIYEDLSFKEIAQIMDCPYDTAKANYRHALLSLKDKMQNEIGVQDWTSDFSEVFSEFSRRAAEAE